VNPRASRIAVIVASVPEFTIRTSSIEGTSRHTVSAIRVSTAVGAPKPRPRSTASRTASITRGWAWPTIIGPHEPT
jgi:hypothetical protein